MTPTARDGPRPSNGEWAVFRFGDIVRCPGYNWATPHVCGKGLGRVPPPPEVAVRVHITGLNDVQLISQCNRCKAEIAWRYSGVLARRPEPSAA